LDFGLGEGWTLLSIASWSFFDRKSEI
jgi:hypothetical protein